MKLKADIKKCLNVVSDKFKLINTNERDTKTGIVLFNDKNIRLSFLKKDFNFTNLSEFKNFLNDNNIKIVYELENPIDEEITDQNLIQALDKLLKIKTYKNITHVNTNSKAKIKLSYKEDLENRLNKIEAMILAE